MPPTYIGGMYIFIIPPLNQAIIAIIIYTNRVVNNEIL